MENDGFMREMQPGMEDEMLTSPESVAGRSSEIAPLQLESHNASDRNLKGTQQGLKIIITSSIFFAISVTIALVLTIYLAPPQVPPHAAIVSDSQQCARTGERLLRRGASAVDASIAVVLCEGLFNPHRSGIGGGGFMVIRKSKENKTHVIDFMDTAPVKLSTAPGESDDVGKFVGVPGLLRGLELAHQKFGKLRWIDVIMPVVELAYSPLELSTEAEEFLKTASPDIKDHFAKVSAFGSGSQVNLTGLGLILQTVASQGADYFYDDVAEEIVTTVRKAGGDMDVKDLNNYKAVERDPVASTFLNMVVESVPAPGGGPLLLLLLNMIENLTMEGVTQWNSTELYHYIVEVMKFALSRQSMLGDSDFARENVTSLLTSKEYASLLASQVDGSQTHSNISYYYSDGSISHLIQGTSQVSVVDPDDDMVSITVSINGPFGSGLVTEHGIILNSHMLNFDDEQTNKNNVPKQGKRPLVAMVPTVIYNPRRPCGQRLALGSANGYSLIAGLAEVIINILGQKMTVEDAIDSPRLYIQEINSDILYEEKFSEDVLNMLEKKQHKCVNLTGGNINTVHAVGKVNETVIGHADSRSGSQVVVY